MLNEGDLTVYGSTLMNVIKNLQRNGLIDKLGV